MGITARSTWAGMFHMQAICEDVTFVYDRHVHVKEKRKRQKFPPISALVSLFGDKNFKASC